ncbi:hypothetical protein BDD12DRAFT_901208 [Trichophaea hybrida]|nr:hypothetical protein BDD12DRAFT_901208 [Trichophaea hybrida]
MPSTPSTPRKRQNISANQATITSFFKPTAAEPTPALPDFVQSGLLSVGMRVRKSVPEGYKSGTYAFNKHLPSVGHVLTPTSFDTDMPSSQESNASSISRTDSPSKKRSFDHDEDTAIHEVKYMPQPPTSISAWARSVKVPTGTGGMGKKKRAFHQTVSRKDVKMVGADDFGEADFLSPVDKMEE